MAIQPANGKSLATLLEGGSQEAEVIRPLPDLDGLQLTGLRVQRVHQDVELLWNDDRGHLTEERCSALDPTRSPVEGDFARWFGVPAE